jgi:hypothetical protein
VPHTFALDWHESDGSPGARFVVDVRALSVTAHGWRVRASIRNGTGATLQIGRIHRAGEAAFGLLVSERRESGQPEDAPFHPTLVASRYRSRLPPALRPGEGWSGVFSGAGRLPARAFVRVVFGTFSSYRGVVLAGRRRTRFSLVTDHVLRLTS